MANGCEPGFWSNRPKTNTEYRIEIRWNFMIKFEFVRKFIQSVFLDCQQLMFITSMAKVYLGKLSNF